TTSTCVGSPDRSRNTMFSFALVPVTVSVPLWTFDLTFGFADAGPARTRESAATAARTPRIRATTTARAEPPESIDVSSPRRLGHQPIAPTARPRQTPPAASYSAGRHR